MPEQDLQEFVRGDTWTQKIVMAEADNTPIDISGDEFWITLKLNPESSDTDADAQRKITAGGADATNGVVFITLDAADTEDLTPARYYYDIQRKSSNKVTTLLYGRVRVIRDITRSYS